MILDAGRATLELFDPQQAETLDRIEVGRRVSGVVRFALHVDDPAAAAEELVAAGATLEHEPVRTWWGDRNAARSGAGRDAAHAVHARRGRLAGPATDLPPQRR